jgi:serine protease Do
MSGSKVLVTLAAILLCAGLVWSAPAQAAPESNPGASMFGRQLVDKIRRGAVYIWAMSPGDSGFLQQSWIGSGFIFQALPEENACLVLSNHHVVNDTALLQIETWDHSTYKGQMLASEPGIDVGLIKVFDIPRENYEPNVMGDSDKVQIGEPGLAVGAPGSGDSVNTDRSNPYISFGLHQTTTMRVVMGKHAEPYEYIGAWAYWRLTLGSQVMCNCPYRFVTQSAINGGNSGGPLYNAQGECIGLNHAHFGPGSTISQNENYTIPINMAKQFAYDILNKGKHEIPWMGIDMIFPPQIVPLNGMDSGGATMSAVTEWQERFYEPKVLKVLNVRKDSPADRAGLQMDDIITEFDGREFPTITDLRLYIFNLPIGKQVPVRIKRGRAKMDLTLTVGVKRGYDAEFSL